MFVTKLDLQARINPEITAALTRNNETFLQSCMATAEGELETYLGSRFDIRAELNRTGSARHSFLLAIATDLTKYHLYSNQETIPSHVENLYKSRLDLLKMLMRGDMALPGVAASPAPTVSPLPGQIGYTSQERRPTLLTPIVHTRLTGV